MFASAVSVTESEVAIPLPPPHPPVPDVPRQHAEAASMLPYQFHRRDGKVRRSRPRDLDHLQRGMTSYQFLLQMDRGTISDSDDDCNPRYTILADRMGNEYNALSRKRCNVCKNSDYPVVLSNCILCKHHVHVKPGSNHQVRVGDSLLPPVPNQYVRCGALTTVGGDIICLKCARTNTWIRTEDWYAPSDQLGQVWTDVPQQEEEVIPGTEVTRQQLDMEPLRPEHIRLA
eukprot:2271168-Amphidinium_carterae.1